MIVVEATKKRGCTEIWEKMLEIIDGKWKDIEKLLLKHTKCI